jgi:hypothetical protein
VTGAALEDIMRHLAPARPHQIPVIIAAMQQIRGPDHRLPGFGEKPLDPHPPRRHQRL